MEKVKVIVNGRIITHRKIINLTDYEIYAPDVSDGAVGIYIYGVLYSQVNVGRKSHLMVKINLDNIVICRNQMREFNENEVMM